MTIANSAVPSTHNQADRQGRVEALRKRGNASRLPSRYSIGPQAS